MLAKQKTFKELKLGRKENELLEINNNKEYQFGDFKITKKEINQMIKFQQKEFNYTDDVARICSIETGDCFIIGKIK